jgi:hypothetical protein
MSTGDYFQVVKRQKREADHSPLSISGIKNVRSYTFTPPYLFMVLSLVKHRDNFPLPLPLPLHSYFWFTKSMCLLNYYKSVFLLYGLMYVVQRSLSMPSVCVQPRILPASRICMSWFSKLWYKYFDRIKPVFVQLGVVTVCTLLTNLFIVGLNAVSPQILIGCLTTQLLQLPPWWMGQETHSWN